MRAAALAMGQCSPCFPLIFGVNARNSGTPKAVAAASCSLERPAPRSLDELDEITVTACLSLLPAASLAQLVATSQGLSLNGTIMQGVLRSRGVPWSFKLRGAHVLEAACADFSFCEGSKGVSGDDGWLTDFGKPAGILGAEIGDHARGGCRQRWSLEILKLKGLLVVGVADQRMKDNTTIGAPSFGRWSCWGWELKPDGRVEAVVAEGIVDVLEGPSEARIDLCPAPGRQVLLRLHVAGTRVELHAQLRDKRSWPWRWRRLGALRCASPSTSELRLVPAVSVNIGASVRLVDDSELET